MTMINLTNLPAEEQKYRSMIQDDPDNGEAWFHLAMVYRKQQKFELAEEAFSRALSINTTTERYFQLGEMLLDRRKYNQALDYLLKVLDDTTFDRYDEAEKLVDTIYSLDSCSL